MRKRLIATLMMSRILFLGIVGIEWIDLVRYTCVPILHIIKFAYLFFYEQHVLISNFIFKEITNKTSIYSLVIPSERQDD